MAGGYWLFKSEPAKFSILDLEKSKDQTTYWEGVRNYQARNFLRDTIALDDKVLFYHSNTEPSGIFGVCKIVREGYPDFSALDIDSRYYDPKSAPDKPIWFMVDVQLLNVFPKPVLLDDIKRNPKLTDIQLLKRGNRLSVFPVAKDHFAEVLGMAGVQAYE